MFVDNFFWDLIFIFFYSFMEAEEPSLAFIPTLDQSLDRFLREFEEEWVIFNLLHLYRYINIFFTIFIFILVHLHLFLVFHHHHLLLIIHYSPLSFIFLFSYHVLSPRLLISFSIFVIDTSPTATISKTSSSSSPLANLEFYYNYFRIYLWTPSCFLSHSIPFVEDTWIILSSF